MEETEHLEKQKSLEGFVFESKKEVAVPKPRILNSALVLLIKAYLEEKACSDYPGLSILRVADIKDGVFFDLDFRGRKFGCVIYDFKAVKLSFYFADAISEEDARFWHKNYQFNLFADSNNSEYRHTLGILQIRSVAELPIKVLMHRTLDKFGQFNRDLKCVIMMLKAVAANV